MRKCQLRLLRAALLMIAVASVSFAGIGIREGAEAQRLPRVTVTISADGDDRRVSTSQTLVGAVLREVGVQLGKFDKVVPGLKDRVRDGSKISVTRVTDKIVSESQQIAFETVKTFTHSLRPGVVRQAKQGVPGQRVIHYRVRLEDGVQVSRTQISSIVAKRPVSQVMEIGSRGRYTSRGAWRTARVLTMSASAYEPGPRSCGRYATGRTATGLKAGYGVAAVDPRVIPMGTRLYVEGYGYAVAADRGRAIKGYRIDLCYNTVREALQFGRRTVKVHVLK